MYKYIMNYEKQCICYAQKNSVRIEAESTLDGKYQKN